jgi:hypothetical protein
MTPDAFTSVRYSGLDAPGPVFVSIDAVEKFPGFT